MDSNCPSHYNSETGRYWYRMVGMESIDAEIALASENALKFFAADLGLSEPYPAIQSVRPESWPAAHEEVSSARTKCLREGKPYECDCFNQPEDLTGYTPFDAGNTIFVRVGLDRSKLVLTIADEVRHIWQDSKFGEGYREDNFEAAEADALNYANEAVRRYT